MRPPFAVLHRSLTPNAVTAAPPLRQQSAYRPRRHLFLSSTLTLPTLPPGVKRLAVNAADAPPARTPIPCRRLFEYVCKIPAYAVW
jgi:hypothetical protein